MNIERRRQCAGVVEGGDVVAANSFGHDAIDSESDDSRIVTVLSV